MTCQCGERAPSSLQPTRAPSELAEQAGAAWLKGARSGVRVSDLLDRLADELAELPGGDALQALLAELSDAYGVESEAYSEAAQLLNAAVAGCRCS